jgi:putative transposase
MRKHPNHQQALVGTLNISRSNLYYENKQEAKDKITKTLIEEALRHHPSYGHKRLAKHLNINKKRVLRVMKIYNIKPYRRRGKKWLKTKTNLVDHPDLLLNIVPQYANHIWASDFTYLWFNGRWLYVATVIDLYTRKIVGLSISRAHDRYLVITALLDALTHYPRPQIIHSDHGQEYCSKDYQNILREVGITPSMAGKGCPWENGYQESFYAQFKVELGDPSRFSSLGELTAYLYYQVYYYNTKRIHSALNMAPVAFARQNEVLLKRELVS